MIDELPENLIDALLETLPCEFTLIDAEDRIVAWNHDSHRLFLRPPDVAQTDVRGCHPQRVRGEVESLLARLKSGETDRVRLWTTSSVGVNREKRKVVVEYCALRGPTGEYLGCVEYGQDLTDLQSLTGEKKTLD
jgi:uncharacterized protein